MYRNTFWAHCMCDITVSDIMLFNVGYVNHKELVVQVVRSPASIVLSFFISFTLRCFLPIDLLTQYPEPQPNQQFLE